MSEPRTLVAGVDSSTQSTKIVVCDAETGQVLRQGRASHPDGTSVHPDRWWEAFGEASADGLLDGVAAIAVGGQQHGMVTLDEQGQVVREALLWNDSRSAKAAEDLIAELGGPDAWAEAIGNVPVAALTVTKLRWLAENEPDLAARVTRVVLPHDWVSAKVLYGDAPVERWFTDRGDASGTGYWSPTTDDYRTDLLERAFGRSLELPEVLAPSATAGRTADGMLVAPGTGDNMGAALGLGLVPGDVVVSLGTSGTVFAVVDQPTGDVNGIQGFADATGRYLPLLCTLNAARVLTAATRLLSTDFAGLDELALAAEPGAGGLTLLPYLDGERTPNLPEATGTLGGMTRENMTPENLARACVEGMLCNLAAGIEGLRAHGNEVRRVFLIGGAAASRAVQEIAPIVFGTPVTIPEPGEYVAIGAARQAAWALAATSGDAPEPPAWAVPTAVELPVHDVEVGARIRERYAALAQQVYGV
ncbi:FGGY family carbohydrate kinase [Arsenicicoccus piscis]|uniref:xylulokinase n=1 Tax=Arsenicicoccus piscis TaxID=673954 RepID=UPI001F4CD40A|nr:FGGY family carbohydrate kinase [Arsenicicoccus piscis]MCH8629256.1 FGGY family carbohydrate kinase [Arsenicicoccus piscis]